MSAPTHRKLRAVSTASPKRAWKLTLPDALSGDAELLDVMRSVTAADYAARDPWTCASLMTSARPGYADRLFAPGSPYHSPITGDRALPANVVNRIRAIWDTAEPLELIEAFFACPRFPLGHHGNGMGREGMWKGSPWIAGEVAAAIRKLGIDRALQQAAAPLDPAKRMGSSFQGYIAGMFETAADFDELLVSSSPVTVLMAGDKTLKKVAAEHLGYQGYKGLDMVARLAVRGRERLFVAEAKFVSEGGGGQDQKVVDALTPKVSRTDFDVLPVAVIDGMPLTPRYRRLYREMIRDAKRPVLSALLLEAFFAAQLDELAAVAR